MPPPPTPLVIFAFALSADGRMDGDIEKKDEIFTIIGMTTVRQAAMMAGMSLTMMATIMAKDDRLHLHNFAVVVVGVVVTFVAVAVVVVVVVVTFVAAVVVVVVAVPAASVAVGHGSVAVEVARVIVAKC